MKTKRQHSCGLTLIETMIVVVVLTILVAISATALRPARGRSKRINCVNNLKQVGLSHLQWALNHNDKFPMQVSITNGGAMEWTQLGIVSPIFQVMSNELNTPKILVCPTDRRRTNAWSFSTNFNNTHISYFVGQDAVETQPQMFLSGDSNLELGGAKVRRGKLTLGTNSMVGWATNWHEKQGNVGLADGSVQGYSTTRLRQAIANTGDLTNGIIIP